MRAHRIALAALVAGLGCDTSAAGFHRAERIGDLTAGIVPRADYRAPYVQACGPGGVTGRGISVFDRWPYVAAFTATSVEIQWTTATRDVHTLEVTDPDGRSIARVPIGADRGYDPVAAGWRGARISGLAPYGMYCYAVRDRSGLLLQRTGFRTAPTQEQTVQNNLTLRLVAMGDLGWRTPDQAAVYRQIRSVPLDFLLLTGDIAYPNGSHEQLDRNFFAVYREMLAHVSALVASGNHDQRTRGGAPLRRSFALQRNYFSRDVGPVHFVILDSVSVGLDQAEWLDADLTANRLPWVIVALHHPPYSSGHHGHDERIKRWFEPIWRRHRVPLVLTGHEHSYERTRPIGGITYVITGGGGRGTRPVGRSDFTAHAAQVAHFVHITVAGNALTLFAVDATGRTFDSAVIYR
ncbi:MAG: metallophosphoesterase [Proteobacteria bacterium]|nr:metallophosphoesterase [Pseudomonadota bacterium]